MKLRKLLVALLAVVMAVGVATAFAACGDEKTENDKSYQLSGEFRDNLEALGNGFDFLLDLNVDGSAALARYNPFSYDTSDAATNENYNAEFMTGTWKAVKKDGVDCLQIKLACHLKGGAIEGDTTVYAYAVAGVYSVEIGFPLLPGMGMSFTRKVTVSGGETKTYADANAFIAAKKMTFTAPESITTFVAKDKDGNTSATLYIQEEGKVLAYYGYAKIGEGTYLKNETLMAVTINNVTIPVTIAENKGTFDYTYDVGGGYSVDLTFTCDDLTKVPAVQPPVYSGTFTLPQMGETPFTITLLGNTDCKYAVSAGGYVFGFDCTYTLKDNVITMTVKEEPENAQLKMFWGMMKDIVWTLNDADHTMTGAMASAAE